MTLLRRMLDVTFIFAEDFWSGVRDGFVGRGDFSFYVRGPREMQERPCSHCVWEGMVEAADGWGFDV